mmetsp:Transcript_40922/g.88661  ORF Transcript_40922/g.88661 Transcript_40922/m.88661 type:complete len:329 (-) Transcript_40922:163-1149(-)
MEKVIQVGSDFTFIVTGSVPGMQLLIDLSKFFAKQILFGGSQVFHQLLRTGRAVQTVQSGGQGHSTVSHAGVPEALVQGQRDKDAEVAEAPWTRWRSAQQRIHRVQNSKVGLVAFPAAACFQKLPEAVQQLVSKEISSEDQVALGRFVQTHVGVSQACHDGGNQHVQGVLDLLGRDTRVDVFEGVPKELKGCQLHRDHLVLQHLAQHLAARTPSIAPVALPGSRLQVLTLQLRGHHLKSALTMIPFTGLKASRNFWPKLCSHHIGNLMQRQIEVNQLWALSDHTGHVTGAVAGPVGPFKQSAALRGGHIFLRGSCRFTGRFRRAGPWG